MRMLLALPASLPLLMTANAWGGTTLDRDPGEPGASDEDAAQIDQIETEEIYGGGQVEPGEWPDTAALVDSWGPFCTGTLIAPTVVLTAGHCLTEGAPTHVVLDTHSLEGGERVAVADAEIYPRSQSTYDIGLVFLQTSAETEPRTLALGCAAEDHLENGARVTLVGYGMTETDENNEAKNSVETEVVDASCEGINRFDCIPAVSPGGELVAGGDGKDSCYGDSGGPLYLHVGDEAYLAGVTSRGATWETDCGGGGIYVRPDAVRDWIEETADIELQEPTCPDGGAGGGGPGLDFNDPDDADAGDDGMVEGGCRDTGLHSAALIAALPILLLGGRRRTTHIET